MMGRDYHYDYDAIASPVHQVTVSDYYISKYEMTNRLSQALGFDSFYQYSLENYAKEFSWKEANEVVNKLNELTGQKYALPTEAQWEYAARGGNKSKGYIYSGSNNASEVAWHEDNHEENPNRLVGLKASNELGLYDMSGNVAEWCSNRFYCYSELAKNPNKNHELDHYYENALMIRGGESGYLWNDSISCQVTSRFCAGENKDAGIRLVLLPD